VSGVPKDEVAVVVPNLSVIRKLALYAVTSRDLAKFPNPVEERSTGFIFNITDGGSENNIT